MVLKNIDCETPFDFGATSADYAKYRDIYPQEFYDKIVSRGLCVRGQKVLDLGTGTGVLPRNMYKYGADWIGIDISGEQINEAISLSKNDGMNIDYIVSSAEDLKFPKGSFDVITACQSFWYFDHEKIAGKLSDMLNPNGRLLILYMAWLPYEDEIARESEKLVLKYNPLWSGAGETMRPIEIPEKLGDFFDMIYHEEWNLQVPFTRESWNGRMRSCRGIGASLSKACVDSWEKEHIELLQKVAPRQFNILHYAALAELKPKRTRDKK